MPPPLSRRSAWPLETSPWTRTVAAARSQGGVLHDLTVTNPTVVGLRYNDTVYRALGTDAVARYDPQPLGLPLARAAVAQYYADRGRAVTPDQVWIVASTSEAYHHLCCLLADVGDAIGVPTPGYPLLDHLTDISGLRRVTYRLEGPRWHIDTPSVRRLRDTASLRLVSAISPHNPCGHVLSHEELEVLHELDVPLLIDEVFADYPLDEVWPLHVRPGNITPSTTLSGLSKVAALPQLKLSWIVLEGPRPWRDALMARAEVLGDAFLSTASAVQLALPQLLREADSMQQRIRARCRENLTTLDERLRDQPLDRAWTAGGWIVLLRLPALPGFDDVMWAKHILEHGRTLTMPGYLFDVERPPRLAISLLAEPHAFTAGIERLIDVVATQCQRG